MIVIGIMDMQQLVGAPAKQPVDVVKGRILLGGAQGAVLVGDEDTLITHGLFALAGGGLTTYVTIALIKNIKKSILQRI